MENKHTLKEMLSMTDLWTQTIVKLNLPLAPCKIVWPPMLNMENKYNLTTKIDGFILQTLMSGTDDWVQAMEIVSHIFWLFAVFRDDVDPAILKAIEQAKDVGGIEEFNIARDLSIAIIRQVLTKGLMKLGSVVHTFNPWALTIEQGLQKVRAEWDEMNGELPMGGVYWLCNTEKGEVKGQKALARWRAWRDVHPDEADDYSEIPETRS